MQWDFPELVIQILTVLLLVSIIIWDTYHTEMPYPNCENEHGGEFFLLSNYNKIEVIEVPLGIIKGKSLDYKQ